jgi:hypothetical protein
MLLCGTQSYKKVIEEYTLPQVTSLSEYHTSPQSVLACGALHSLRQSPAIGPVRELLSAMGTCSQPRGLHSVLSIWILLALCLLRRFVLPFLRTLGRPTLPLSQESTPPRTHRPLLSQHPLDAACPRRRRRGRERRQKRLQSSQQKAKPMTLRPTYMAKELCTPPRVGRCSGKVVSSSSSSSFSSSSSSVYTNEILHTSMTFLRTAHCTLPTMERRRSIRDARE